MQPLLAGPRAGLDETAVAEALTLARGATVRHGLDVLDLAGQQMDVRLPMVGGEVSWSWRAPELGGESGSQVAAVRRQARVDVTGAVAVDLTGVRLRPWTEWLLLTGQWARWHLGVFTVTDPGSLDDDGQVLTRSLVLADKSHEWSEVRLDQPLYLPGSTVAVDWVKARLASVFGETAFAIETSAATIGQPRTFEAGTSELEVMSRVLEAVGFDQLTADEDGRPASRSLATLAGQGAQVAYGPGEHKVLTAGSVSALLPSIPNVLRFSARQGPSLGNVEGNGLRTVKNQSTGPASIDGRGREVPLTVEVDVDSQTALDAYATANAGRWFAGGGWRYEGRVAINPRFGDRDVIGLTLPRLGLTGEWAVTSWTYPLREIRSDGDVLMQVSAERRVSL